MFKRVTGELEEHFSKHPSHPIFHGKKGWVFTNPETKEEYESGFFILSLLKSLIPEEEQEQNNKRPIPFSIMEPDSKKSNVDIRLLQSDPQNAGCMFQVASNFNALECASEYDYPDRTKNFVTKYEFDPTQGTFASFAALPGAIFRTYFGNYQLHAQDQINSYQSLGTMQTEKDQLNLLQEYPECKVRNGKLIECSIEPKESYLENIWVAIQSGVRVTYGLRYKNQHLIHQVFCSTMPLGRYPVKSEALMTILRSAYHSAYAAANQTQAPVLYLTLVGGGVFQNPIEMIVRSIKEVHQFWSSRKHSIGRVVLVVFNPGYVNECKKLVQEL